jgi:hypothetical protein
MRENFSQSQSAVTYDSDPRFLKFLKKNKTTGVEYGIADPYNPSLLDATDPLYWLISAPYECRQRNRVGFQSQFITPPETVTPQPPIVTDYPLYTEGSETIVVHQNAVGLQPHSFSVNAYNVKLLTADPLKFIKGIDVALTTPFGGAVPTDTIQANLYLNPTDASLGADKSVVLAESLQPAITFPIGPTIAGGTTVSSAAHIAIPYEGQSIELSLTSSFLLDTAEAPGGVLTITLHYETRTVVNAYKVHYTDFITQSGSSAIVNIPTPMPPGGPTVRLKRVQLFVSQRWRSNAGSGVNIIASASMNSGSTVFATVSAGDSITLSDNYGDSGDVTFDYSGNVLGIGIDVDTGLLSDLSQGELYISVDWETTIPQPPIVTPFTWAGSDIIGIYLYGSYDGVHYDKITAATGLLGSEIQISDSNIPALFVNLPIALTRAPAIVGNGFGDSFSFTPIGVYWADADTTKNRAVLPVQQPYNFYRVLITRDVQEGASVDNAVTMSVLAIAREV